MIRSRGLWPPHAALATIVCAISVRAADAATAKGPHGSEHMPAPPHYKDWQALGSSPCRDPALAVRVHKIVANMSPARKTGRMTGAGIKSITPAQVTRNYIGSVLDGGDANPGST